MNSIPDAPEMKLEEIAVKVNRCATVVKGGKRFSFSALVAVGNRDGIVGWGFGKANEVPQAVDKAIKDARRRLIRIPLTNGTIPYEVHGKWGSSRVIMMPAAPGTGIIAGASVRSILELAGVHNVLTKAHGSTTALNLVKATFEGLKSLKSIKEIERIRGVRILETASA